MNTTVIYITSNREEESFESKIRDKLLETIGDTPLISVSHKPIDFGKNICVGDVGLSSHNCRRQFLIGAEEAKTKYVCIAESDFLYPKEYFSYVPKTSIARTRHIYVVWPNRHWYYRKSFSDGAIIAEREFIINVIESLLDGKPEWSTKEEHLTFYGIPFELWNNATPVVTFKTYNGMHIKTNILKNQKTKELPVWGSVEDLKLEFLCHQG